MNKTQNFVELSSVAVWQRYTDNFACQCLGLLRASLIAQLVKNLPAMQETWVGKTPWKRERLLTPIFWPGEFHRLYSPWGRKESDMTERLSLHFTSGLLRPLSGQRMMKVDCGAGRFSVDVSLNYHQPRPWLLLHPFPLGSSPFPDLLLPCTLLSFSRMPFITWHTT